MESNIQEIQYSPGEPGHLAGGSLHQLIEIPDPVQAHECRQVCMFEIFDPRFPNDLTAESKWLGHGLLLGSWLAEF
jgi:hypothetical protein